MDPNGHNPRRYNPLQIIPENGARILFSNNQPMKSFTQVCLSEPPQTGTSPAVTLPPDCMQPMKVIHVTPSRAVYNIREMSQGAGDVGRRGSVDSGLSYVVRHSGGDCGWHGNSEPAYLTSMNSPYTPCSGQTDGNMDRAQRRPIIRLGPGYSNSSPVYHVGGAAGGAVASEEMGHQLLRNYYHPQRLYSNDATTSSTVKLPHGSVSFPQTAGDPQSLVQTFSQPTPGTGYSGYSAVTSPRIINIGRQETRDQTKPQVIRYRVVSQESNPLSSSELRANGENHRPNEFLHRNAPDNSTMTGYSHQIPTYQTKRVVVNNPTTSNADGNPPETFLLGGPSGRRVSVQMIGGRSRDEGGRGGGCWASAAGEGPRRRGSTPAVYRSFDQAPWCRGPEQVITRQDSGAILIPSTPSSLHQAGTPNLMSVHLITTPVTEQSDSRPILSDDQRLADFNKIISDNSQVLLSSQGQACFNPATPWRKPLAPWRTNARSDEGKTTNPNVAPSTDPNCALTFTTGADCTSEQPSDDRNLFSKYRFQFGSIGNFGQAVSKESGNQSGSDDVSHPGTVRHGTSGSGTKRRMGSTSGGPVAVFFFKDFDDMVVHMRELMLRESCNTGDVVSCQNDALTSSREPDIVSSCSIEPPVMTVNDRNLPSTSQLTSSSRTSCPAEFLARLRTTHPTFNIQRDPPEGVDSGYDSLDSKNSSRLVGRRSRVKVGNISGLGNGGEKVQDPMDPPQGTTQQIFSRARVDWPREALRQKIEMFNRNTFGLIISLQQDCESFDGIIRVRMSLIRPVQMSTGSQQQLQQASQQQDSRRAAAIASAATSENTVLARTASGPPDLVATDEATTSFYLPKDTSKVIHISSTATTKEVIRSLLSKFMIKDNPLQFALYENTKTVGLPGLALVTDRLRRLNDDDNPLVLCLSWIDEGLDGLTTHEFVLQENDTGDILWDAFSLPELENFLVILDKEAEEYIKEVRVAYRLLKIQMFKRMKALETAESS